jgi:hypothetical protein
MKYIIKESRLNKAIYEYLTELFGNIYFLDSINYNTEVEDGEILEFINDDYEDSGDFIFEYITRDFYERQEDSSDVKQKFLDQSPIVVFNYMVSDKLNNLFGIHWRPVFVRWMEDKFNLPVNTIFDK